MKKVANIFLEENKYLRSIFMLVGSLILASFFENFISQLRNPGSGNNWVSL